MKTIDFTYNEKDYRLGFTRETVKQSEAMGLNISEFESKPLTTLETLFRCSFLLHHRREKEDTIKAIFSLIEDKDSLTASLVELYQDTILSVMENKESKNSIKWEMK